ncbi:HORMA domain-containing protein 2-like isoform X1 [Zophobas morio]|uniref:HORMA domain-containing protein 2-like isoform X1 n=1 Tax=Zophobas morio TaxID=2755281 RepID=UPI003082CC0F
MATVKVRDSVVCMTLTDSTVKKAVKSYTMSKRYINTMLKATAINILYHRLSIDENQFITKKFKEITYRSFKSKSKNIFIRNFHTYMLACKDAIDKNYLHEFFLFIIDTSSGDVIENYKFSFQYAENDEQKSAQSGENLIESTCELLRTLEELGKHKKFDAEIEIRVEFTYFDDTPEDYEPPGFHNIDESESFVKKIDKGGNSVIIGTLFTGFHMMKCRGKGDIFNFNRTPTPSNEECEVNEAIEEAESKVNENPSGVTGMTVTNNDIFTEDFLEETENGKARGKKENDHNKTLNDTYMSACIDISSDEDDAVDCPCKLPTMDSCQVDDIACSMCKRRYHTPCQGYLDNSYIHGNFRCCYCKGENDSIFAPFDVRQSMYLYRIRYIVGTLYKYKNVPEEFKTVFGDTLKNLEKFGIFDFEGSVIKSVNTKLLYDLFKSDYIYKLPEAGQFKNIAL